MTEILDHAITVRDVLWVWLGVFLFLALLISAGVVWWLIHERKCERERQRLGEQIRKDYANAPPFPTRFDRDGKPIYHLRNPAFGVPKSGVKFENGRPYVTE